MFNQENIPDGALAIGVGLVGVVFGFGAALTYVLALPLGVNYSLWLALPLSFTSGALGMAAVVAALAIWEHLAIRRRRFGPKPATRSEIRPGHSIPSGSGSGMGVNHPRSSTVSESFGHVGRAEATQVEDALHGRWGLAATAAGRPRRIARLVPELHIVDGGAAPGAAGLTSDIPGTVPSSGTGCGKSGLRPEDGSGDARLLPPSEAVLGRHIGRLIELRPEWVHGPEGVVGYLGHDDGDSVRAIANWAGARYDAFLSSSADETSWREIDGLLHRAGVFFVDADSVGDAGEAVDLCLRLRACSPNTPLILISSDVREHDLTAERAAICDATLKKPLTAGSIEMGISAAHRNASRIASPSAFPTTAVKERIGAVD